MKSYSITYKNRKAMFAALYDLLHWDMLTNPEITFFTRHKASGEPRTLTYSRDGVTGEGKLSDEREWESLTLRSTPEGVLCVASTDSQDARRLTVAFLPRDKVDSTLLINFPNAQDCLTGREKRVLGFLGERAQQNV